MEEAPQEFFFYSETFGIDAAEVEETNPFLFGRELAVWLCGKLKEKGYSPEVVAEDWGWCVLCQRQPYSLFVACFSALDENLIERSKDPSSTAPILWRAIPVAEKTLFQRLRNSENIEPVFRKLLEDLRFILESEPSVRMATAQEITAWEDGVVDVVEEHFDDVHVPKPVSRWISVPIGLLTLPILLISAIGAVTLLFDNPREYEVIRPVAGTILLVLIVLIGLAVMRMLVGKPPFGGPFPPALLRALAILLFALPIGGLFTGWYVEHPIMGTVQAILYFLIGSSLWRRARARAEKLTREREEAET